MEVSSRSGWGGYGLSWLVGVLVAGGHVAAQVTVALVLFFTKVAAVPNAELISVPTLDVLAHLLLSLAGKLTQATNELPFASTVTALYQLAEDELGSFWVGQRSVRRNFRWAVIRAIQGKDFVPSPRVWEVLLVLCTFILNAVIIAA